MLGDTLIIRDSLQHAVMFDSIGNAPVEELCAGDTLEQLHVEEAEPLSLFQGIEIPYRPADDDIVAIILLFCFFLTAFVLAGGKGMLIQQLKGFFSVKERGSLFAESASTDYRYLSLLLFQTCVIASFCVFDLVAEIHPVLVGRHVLLLGIYVCIFVLYYLLKWGVYSFINWTFFDKTKSKLFVSTYFFLFSGLGLALFPVVLLAVYADLRVELVVSISLGIIIIAKLLLFYKGIKLFFDNLYGLFWLIAYFCALEVMPVLMLYKVFALVNNLLLIKH